MDKCLGLNAFSFFKSILGISIGLHSLASSFSGNQNHEIIKILGSYYKMKYNHFDSAEVTNDFTETRKISSWGLIQKVSADHVRIIAVSRGDILSLHEHNTNMLGF